MFLDEIPEESGNVIVQYTHKFVNTNNLYSLVWFTLNSGGCGSLLGMGGKVEVCRIYNKKIET